MGNCPTAGTAVCPPDVCNTNPPLFYYDEASYTQYRCSNECQLPWVATTVAGGLIEAPLGECRLLQNPVDGVTACNNSINWCESNTDGKFIWNSALAWNQVSDQSCEPGLTRTTCYKQSNYTPISLSPNPAFTLDGQENGGVQAYRFTMVGSSVLSFFGDFLGELAAHLGIFINTELLASLNQVSVTLTCYTDNENMPGYLVLGDGTGNPMHAININIPNVDDLSLQLARLITTINDLQFPYPVGIISLPIYFDLYDLTDMPNTGPSFPQSGRVYYVSPAQSMIDLIVNLTQNLLPNVASEAQRYAQLYRSLVGRGIAVQAEPGITTLAGFGGIYLLQGAQPMMNIDFGLWNSGSDAASPIFLVGAPLPPRVVLEPPPPPDPRNPVLIFVTLAVILLLVAIFSRR